MSDETPPQLNGGNAESPFPSRRSIHASRIPSRKGPITSPVPAVLNPVEDDAGHSHASETDREDRKHAHEVSNRLEEVDPGESLGLADPTAAPGAAGSPFPTRRQHLTETGALALGALKAETGSRGKKKTKNKAPAKAEPTLAQGPTPARRDASPFTPDSTQAPPVRRKAAAPSGQRLRVPVKVKKKKAPGWRVAIVLIVVVALIGGASYLAYRSLVPDSTKPVAQALDFPGPGEGSVEVAITSGELGSQIGQSLVDAGVVKSLEGFIKAFEANSAASTIKPGTYTLRKGMTSAAALAALLDEANRRDNAITVNAGQTAEQVFAKMVSVGGFTREAIDEALADPSSLGLPESADGKIEGWLAVGSYDFATDVTAAQALTTMVERTKDTLSGLGVPEDEWENVLIKASILEREAGLEIDMPKVARVISNRLDNPEAETRGLLQMDSTVLYGVDKYGGLPTSEDLASDSPYNTYKVKGLPPTPIASPSLAAIEATINPAEGNWLYFVTVNLDTGETLFASNLDEQTKNIEQLNQWCSQNQGRC